jgi:two-component system, chemotaxis family, chemotaxis protein CheY
MTILVVEDNPSIREMLLDLLEREGYAVEGAGSGQEALDYLYRCSGFMPDGACPRLILLDLMMPEMNGWAFRLRQMAEPKWSDIPVVVISEVAELPKHAAMLRVADYLAKPIKIGSLLAVVRRHYQNAEPCPI